MEFVEYIDKLIEKLNPGEFHIARKSYLYYIKAMIYFRNHKFIEAKEVLEVFFESINEEEIYTTYFDINDLNLEILKMLNLINVD